MKKAIILLISLLFVLTACSEKPHSSSNDTSKNNSAESNLDKMKTHETDEFSISYPSSWKEYDIAAFNNPILKVSFADHAPTTPFADNLNVGIENTTLTAKESAELSSSQFKNGFGGDTIKNYKQISYSDYTDSYSNAGILKAEYTQARSEVPIILTQYVISTGKQVFTLSVGFSKKSYDNGGEDIINQIIKSFKIKNITNTTLKEQPKAMSGEQLQKTRIADLISQVVPKVAENVEMDSKTYDYIVNHYELFPALTLESKKSAKSKVDPNITTRHLFKNLNPYLDKMVTVSGSVVDITEEETEAGTIACIQITDENMNSIVGIYTNSTGDILDGDNVTMRGVPVTTYSFDNVSGGTTNAVLLGVSTIQKNH